ncbi:MAG: FkbM family methyltransferase [Opitutales bacterium]|nr:FkbM family methyltransferase [Opitutales bacterium]
MFDALEKARDSWGVFPQSVVDVGAANGKWSLRCAKIWPDAEYILIEPLEENLAPLAAIIDKRTSWKHVCAAAGKCAGEIEFSVTPDLDGSGFYEDRADFAKRKVQVIALDDIPTKSGDCLLKLDTHGYEVPIFEGAKNLLKRTSLLVVEVYGQKLTPQSLLFYEICQYLRERGFRLADLVDIMRRPSDGSFWQADMFFLRAEHPIFANNRYSPETK